MISSGPGIFPSTIGLDRPGSKGRLNAGRVLPTFLFLSRSRGWQGERESDVSLHRTFSLLPFPRSR